MLGQQSRYLQTSARHTYDVTRGTVAAAARQVIRGPQASPYRYRDAETGHRIGRAAQLSRTKPIEQIEVGDSVMAWDEEQRQLVARPVCRLFRRENRHVVEVLCADATTGKRHTVVATSEHPFWVNAKGWVSAQELSAGDSLKCIDNDGGVQVVGVNNAGRTADVFNFEVFGFHNYFVGLNGVLVHNHSDKSVLALNPDIDRSEQSTVEPPPRPGSDTYSALVRDARHQILASRSYAVVDLSKYFNSALHHDFWAGSPSGIMAEINGITGGYGIKQIGDDHRAVNFQPLGHERVRLIEDRKTWLTNLTVDSFGSEFSPVNSWDIRGRLSFSKSHAQAIQLHPDGGTLAFAVSTMGPGPEVLSPHPTVLPRTPNGGLDLSAIKNLPDPIRRVNPGHALLFGAYHVGRINPILLPTIHQGTQFDGQRGILIGRGSH